MVAHRKQSHGTLELPRFNGVIEKAERMPLSPGEPDKLNVAPDAREVAISESPVYLFLKLRD